ncbi:ATP-grasp domain-containing protein [Candidatus Stoquefichus sp. SB1]|uniref:ATP-grasp domain-containing protein n=1 Tax=Candidatus Stoquefichus sp. SB1 TaxID=1658109 RepID=UPI00067E8DB5|nr:ATP-grasp domain-containing protein [Candidatus Stoquefichus sp. SB1]
MKKIMILGASELQLPAIQCANSMGIETIVLDFDANAIGRNEASKFYEVSTLDYDKVLEIAKFEKIDGIMTICSDRPMTVVARVGEKLGLNTISYETALKATDKGLMRKALFENNVPIPQFFICRTYEDVEHAVNSIQGECIFKPSNNSGSRGIYLYDENKNLQDAYSYSKQYSTDNIVLVEEFMKGPEVSVEAFVINGEVNIIQITDKITTGAPYFVEMGHTQPSSLPNDIQSQIRKVAIKGIQALNIDNGPAHVEIKVTEQGPKIVEIGARLGGDYITTDLVPLSTGVNMVELTIKNALNFPVDIKKLFLKSSAIRYINDELEIPEEFKTKVTYYFNKDIQLSDIKSSNDRRGYYIIQTMNLDELDSVISEIQRINERR